MKPFFHSLLLIGILLFSSFGAVSAAESEGISFVASYENTRVGERVFSLLHRNKIEWVTITGRGVSKVTIGVPPHQASEARRLLAQAIKAEKLELTLLIKKGNYLCAVVSPDIILDSTSDQTSK